MKEKENKKSKKKVLLYYLILAACLLVIAAVTVTVIFAVNRSKSPNLSIDNTVTTPPDDDKQPDDDKKPDDDKPTANPTDFLLPVTTPNVSCNYEFCKNETIKMWLFHKGIDFEGSVGDKVCAVLDGTVKKVVNQSTPAALMYGGYVTIEHANGITTTYKFIDVKEGLKEGDAVKRGDEIGAIAKASGIEMAQGDHLHFEVTVHGKPADPDTYLDIIEK